MRQQRRATNPAVPAARNLVMRIHGFYIINYCVQCVYNYNYNYNYNLGNLGNSRGTGEIVPFVTRTHESGVAIATLLSVVRTVPV